MLTAEYKREINQNYLIFPAGPDVDPDSFQVRMLLNGKVPGLLSCMLQNIDGAVRAYYDITSKQALHLVQDGRQLRKEDLLLVFEGFIRVMESMGEYLMSPDMLVLDLNYIYTDPQQKELFFCCLPGYNTPIRTQFQKLTEGLLPFMDHEDAEAVMLGYSVYRHALEDTFHLEQIKEELYRCKKTTAPSGTDSGRPVQSQSFPIREEFSGSSWEVLPESNPGPPHGGRTDPPPGQPFEKPLSASAEALSSAGQPTSVFSASSEKDRKYKGLEIFDETLQEDRFTEKTNVQAEENPLKNMQQWRRDPQEKNGSGKRSWILRLLFLAAGTIVLLILCVLQTMGYLPGIPPETLLGGGIAVMAVGVLVEMTVHKRKNTGFSKGNSSRKRRHGEAIRHQASEESNTPVRFAAEKSTTFHSGQQPVEFSTPFQPGQQPVEFSTPFQPGQQPVESGGSQAAPLRSFRSLDQPEDHSISRHRDIKEPEDEGFSQTVLLTAASHTGPSSLVSREPGELPTIYLSEELTIIGKMKNAADAVIELPTVSRIHARIRRRDDEYYLTDLNSRNGTTVNGHILSGDEEWQLNDQDEVDFAQARYLFIK